MLSSRSSRAVRFASGTPLGARDAPSPRPSGWAPTPSTRGATPSSIRQGFAASTPLTTGNMMSAQGAQHGRTGSTPSNRLTATPKAAGARNAPENTSAVKVAVRVRPFSSTERADRCRSVVRMQNQSTYLIDPSGIGEPDEDLYTREFCYDYSYWSFDKVCDAFLHVYQSCGTSRLCAMWCSQWTCTLHCRRTTITQAKTASFKTWACLSSRMPSRATIALFLHTARQELAKVTR